MKKLTVFLVDDETVELEIKTWELRGNCLIVVSAADETVGIPVTHIKRFVIIDKDRDISIE